MRHITEIGPAKVARPKSGVLKTHVLVAFFWKSKLACICV